MAQAAAMGPPLSPRETRRSGRRSAPSISASKSPDSDHAPKLKETSRVSSSSTSTSARNKRLKQEEYEESVEDRKGNQTSSVASSNSNNGTNGSKGKRKPKDKDKEKPSSSHSVEPEAPPAEDQAQDPGDDEEQGITRCICGSAEDDPDAGEFMVQCETCKVWQHGLCMGYQSEDQVHDDDYYCELCRPELHEELLKKHPKRPRQVSASSKGDTVVPSRVSRSHSPSHLLKQASKRRNTMNSRDAAFDESLKELIEQSAAEAAAVQSVAGDATSTSANDSTKKKRKRTDDDGNPKKRTRSASTASDQPVPPPANRDSPAPEKPIMQLSKPTVRNKRGGRKNATIDAAPTEGEEGQANNAAPKRQASSSRAKNNALAKRPPLSHSVSGSGTEHITRRNQVANQQSASGKTESSRAYRNSHAYAVSQQTLYTSWGLPDYLSHLEEILPTDVPQPLEISTATANSTRGQSAERTMERGVKVKWPSKRMSVGDMNKRVRALVEWVGREQANALDRSRRREALEKAIREQNLLEDTNPPNPPNTGNNDDSVPADGSTTPVSDPKMSLAMLMEGAADMSNSTMKMMEELMEELISFQERFGPGSKSREKKLNTS